MYDIVTQIIDHNWVSNYTNDQQYIYYIVGAIIIILLCTFIDMIYRVLSHFWHA